ncbi:MAG: twin-arginine translocase TatA/TatE family subunit [Planctomycetota bacterium]|nr:twin-arginine translocase TatA/TatE family subunit [Planctomycetota bacterium]
MATLAFLQNIGLWEGLLILVVVLLIFGSRLPSLGRSLGRSITEFKTGLKEGQEEGEKESADKKEEAKATASKD